MLNSLILQLKQFPEYFLALKAALVVLLVGLPLYLGLRFFLYRRKLSISIGVTLNFIGTFILFAGLAFLQASPLSVYLPAAAMSAYLFMTCIAAALGAVAFIDVFLVRYYLMQVKRVYVSPPLRVVIKISVFVVTLLPILRYVLHFNPLALVAIPTIATAAIAFALQDTLKTFIAGVGLGQMIRLGEWIAYDGKEGRVVDINWARTVIENAEGQRVYIPNSALQTHMFMNFTSGNPANRQALKVGASYDVPPARVKEVLKQCAATTPGVAASPLPASAVMEYADSAVIYGLFYWIEDYARRAQIQDDVSTRVWYAFRREGIEIPYPKRTMQLQRTSDPGKKLQETVKRKLKIWNLADAFLGDEMDELSRATRCKLFAPGEIIVKKGASGDSVFCIVSGEAEVYLFPEAAQPIAVLGPRDTFGEMSFLTGAPRAATIVAKTALEVLEIDNPALQVILARRPELSERLAEVVHKRQEALAAATAQRHDTSPSSNIAPKETLSRQIRDFFGLS